MLENNANGANRLLYIRSPPGPVPAGPNVTPVWANVIVLLSATLTISKPTELRIATVLAAVVCRVVLPETFKVPLTMVDPFSVLLVADTAKALVPHTADIPLVETK